MIFQAFLQILAEQSIYKQFFWVYLSLISGLIQSILVFWPTFGTHFIDYLKIIHFLGVPLVLTIAIFFHRSHLTLKKAILVDIERDNHEFECITTVLSNLPMGIAMFDQIYINNETNNDQKIDTEQRGDSSKI